MGELVMKSRSGYKWMVESSEEDEEEKELELRLGLPGGGGGGGGGGGEGRKAACKEKEKHHTVDHSMLSLGYSPMLTHSQGKRNGQAEAHAAAVAGNTLASNSTSQTRSANAPVIGWPPVRTFRRNLASSSKQNEKSYIITKSDDVKKALFVKINMDGIPIGRKIDLKAYDCYDKLSLAVDELFRGLLAAQKDPHASGTKDGAQQQEAIAGLLDGTGEYTLVYEDYEGDRVLVGDVPWGMFVSSVKRLRVLKTADLSSSLIASSRTRAAAEY